MEVPRLLGHFNPHSLHQRSHITATLSNTFPKAPMVGENKLWLVWWSQLAFGWTNLLTKLDRLTYLRKWHSFTHQDAPLKRSWQCGWVPSCFPSVGQLRHTFNQTAAKPTRNPFNPVFPVPGPSIVVNIQLAKASGMGGKQSYGW